MEETEDQKRLRGVEEAVIEFKQIAKYVIGEHALRIKDLEDDMDDMKTTMYDSCDLKTKEIDGKVRESSKDLFKWLTYVATSVVAVAGLGLAAVVYFNEHVSAVERDIATIKTIQENRNLQIIDILTELRGISTLMRKQELGDKEDR